MEGLNSGALPSPRKERRIAADGELLFAGLTRTAIGCFYRVYNRLGDGYLEAVYVEALRLELLRAGLEVEKEAVLDVWDEGEKVGHYRVDLLVAGELVLEIKAGAVLHESARRQLRNYLRCIDQPIGLLLHFGPRPRFSRVLQTTNLGRTPRHPR
jgi:GxxExxY protein